MALERAGLVAIIDTVDSEGCAAVPFVWAAAFATCVHTMLGCRNTALHVAVTSKRVHGRAAMVTFLIAERADVNKANKKGCAPQRCSEQGGGARIARCRES